MKKDKQYGKIYETTDYDQFNFVKGNRKLRVYNLEKMRQSMIEEQLVMPICVNEKMEIIDGQHRYTTCKELGKPLYYYIQEGYGLEQVERANRSNTNWVLSDFLQSFTEKGNETYKLIQEIIDTYEVSASDVVKVIAKITDESVNVVTENFKHEKMTIDNNMQEKIMNFFECLTLFNGFSSYKKSKFISSYLELYYHPKYDHEHMIKKYEIYSKQLKHCTTKDEYIKTLCNSIYSAGKLNRSKSIYYDAARGEFYNS